MNNTAPRDIGDGSVVLPDARKQYEGPQAPPASNPEQPPGLPDFSGRSLVTVGPKHSGKSVFAYLAFKAARDAGNDAALVEADVFSPGHLKYAFCTEEESNHSYSIGSKKKLTGGGLSLQVYENFLTLMEQYITETGLVVYDGLGRQSEFCDALLRRARYLVVVSKVPLSEEEMREAGYSANGDHPVDAHAFYSGRCARVINVQTTLSSGTASFDESVPKASLFGLERDRIRQGDTSQIPSECVEVIRRLVGWIVSGLSAPSPSIGS